MTAARDSRLPLYLASAYTLLALYGSLYPFSGWHDSGVGPLDFLAASWLRHTTSFDLIANTLAYGPLGFLWVTVLRSRLPAPLAGFLSALACALFSLGIEAVQNYLPSRVPSHLDLACNSLGGLLGAMAGLRWGTHLLDGGRLHDWREQRFLAGPVGDRGLLLLALWLLTQLNPETFLFGNGNLRALLGLPAPLAFEAVRFFELELLTVTAHVFALALVAGWLAHGHPRQAVLALIGVALVVKSMALMVLMQSVHGFAWMTPGTLGGLALGLALWGWAQGGSPGTQRALAAMALMLATVLVNLMPDNPYLEHTLRVWRQGYFLNFNGATRLASSLWPFLALPWLMLARNPKW